MSLNVDRWRPAPLAPRLTGWGLWAAVMLVTVLGAAISIFGVAGARAMVNARAQWNGTLTVAALAHDLETSDAAAARIEDVLNRRPGVASVAVLDPRADDALIGRLLGVGGAGTQAPRFLSVRLEKAATLSEADIAGLLQSRGLRTRIDDHRRWTAPVERAALVAACAAAAGVAVVIAAFAALAAHAARLGVRRVGARMSLMRSMGATQGFLAAQFPGKISVSAAIGAGLGSVAAVGLIAGGAEKMAPWLTSGLALDVWDYPAAVVWPLVAGGVAWLFARLGAGRALGRLR